MKRLVVLVLLLACGAFAGAEDRVENVGDWVVVYPDDSNDVVAATMNESQNLLAFRCFAETKQCVHVLRAGIKCENGEGEGYPILVNSDSSPMSMDAFCSINGKEHELILTNYDAIHHILMDGSYVGFAIPMSSGLFKVVRFSLLGSDKAMRKVEEEVHRQAPRNGETYL